MVQAISTADTMRYPIFIILRMFLLGRNIAILERKNMMESGAPIPVFWKARRRHRIPEKKKMMLAILFRKKIFLCMMVVMSG